MIKLFPEGFEETEGDGGVELAAYTGEDGEERLWHAFGGARSTTVEDGWEERWKRFHQPVLVGPLWVGPPWETPPPGTESIVIDPGRAFGTGGHPTTRLALELLLEAPRGSLLDVGCGSGVLAIAAAKLGFAPVVAIDHDPLAVEATATNAAANGVDVDVRRADALKDALCETDLATANIALRPVEMLAARIDVAQLVSSGYIAAEEPRMGQYERLERRTADGWAADRWTRVSAPRRPVVRAASSP